MTDLQLRREEVTKRGRGSRGEKLGQDSVRVPQVIWEPRKEMKGKVD